MTSWNNLGKGAPKVPDPAGNDLPWDDIVPVSNETPPTAGLPEWAKQEVQKTSKVISGEKPLGGATSTLLTSGAVQGNLPLGTKSSHAGTRCFHTHPPYEVAPGKFIHGGSCCSPAINDMDVHIGFDAGMLSTPRRFPWEPGDEILFRITDRDVPVSVSQFKNLIAWTAEQIDLGRKVHAGCIGGHGRTGTFFAALRRHMTGDMDSITHVRENYCKKAVESKKQVDWLNEQFGITKQPPTDKAHTHTTHKTTGSTGTYPAYKAPGKSGTKTTVGVVTLPTRRDAAGSIWRPSA